MFVGAFRDHGGLHVAEAVWDVTGRTSVSGCVADPEKLVAALAQMDAAGTVFGLLAHSHPGRSPQATNPSRLDLESYALQLARGESPNLVGAVFAGSYVRFFGAVDWVAVTGGRLRLISSEYPLYELAASTPT
jgi:hypothetical protein